MGGSPIVNVSLYTKKIGSLVTYSIGLQTPIGVSQKTRLVFTLLAVVTNGKFCGLHTSGWFAGTFFKKKRT